MLATLHLRSVAVSEWLNELPMLLINAVYQGAAVIRRARGAEMGVHWLVRLCLVLQVETTVVLAEIAGKGNENGHRGNTNTNEMLMSTRTGMGTRTRMQMRT
jgi:hypothetical protein